MGDMDSGNSASIQSSSTAGGCAGDDQEFESHGGGDPGVGGVLFNQTSLASFDNTGSLQLYSLNNGSSTYNNFDPLTNNFDTNFMINQNHNSDRTNNNDSELLWPSTICSPLGNKNCTTSSSTTTTTMVPATGLNPNNTNNNQLSGICPLPVSIPSSGAPMISDHPGSGGIGSVRNPKKRSRASRRTPTTVLTTDTNNFRQMVQEFTGIPASPFLGRTRLDLLGGTGIHVSSQGVHQTPPYVLRPFPQKIVPSNHLSINTTLNPQSCINNTNNNQSVLTLQSLLPQFSSSTVESIYGSGINTGLGSNAAGFLINQFALGSVTTTATPATNVITTALNHDRLPVNDGGSSSGNAGTSLENHGGVTRSEGMVDSWICSSD